MAKDNSVAPRERVNVTFTPNTGDVQQDVELPLKLVVLGDFTQRQDERSIEQRKPITVDASNFDDVLAKQELSLAFTVPRQSRAAGSRAAATDGVARSSGRPQGAAGQHPRLSPRDRSPAQR